MPLAVTISDNGDGTGFTATLSGTGGASASVWYTPADRPWPGDPWTLGGTRVGDGTLAVNIPNRFYFAYASTATELTPPERFVVSSGWQEPHTLLQNGLAALIATMNLPSQRDYEEQRTIGAADWTGVRVLTQLSEDATERNYPCITLTVGDEQESLGPKGTNSTDDVIYPVRVMMFDKPILGRRQWGLPWVQYCRSKISKAIRFQHSLGVPSLVECKVRYNRITVRRLDSIDGLGGTIFDGYAGGFLIEMTNREPRGLGA